MNVVVDPGVSFSLVSYTAPSYTSITHTFNSGYISLYYSEQQLQQSKAMCHCDSMCECECQRARQEKGSCGMKLKAVDTAELQNTHHGRKNMSTEGSQ